MPDVIDYNVGDKVTFLGFDASAGDPPKGAEFLKEGQSYIIAKRFESNDEEVLPSFQLKVGRRKVEVVVSEIEAYTTAEVVPIKTEVVSKEVPAQEAYEAMMKDPDLSDMKGLILSRDQQDPEMVMLAEDADDPVQLCKEILTDISSGEYKAGAMALFVRTNGLYKTVDPRYAEKGGWALFCEEVLNTSYRVVMHFVRIYSTFSRFGIHGDTVARLGWTKCQELCSYMTAENSEALIELADQAGTVKDLQASIKESFGDDSSESKMVRRITFKFRLEESQAMIVREFIEKAMKQYGLQNENAIFEIMISEWALQNLDQRTARRAEKLKLAVEAKAQEEVELAAEKEARAKERAAKKVAAAKKKAKKKVSKKVSKKVTKKVAKKAGKKTTARKVVIKKAPVKKVLAKKKVVTPRIRGKKVITKKVANG